MRQETVKRKVIDLLQWVKDVGFEPTHHNILDRHVNPFTNRLGYYGSLPQSRYKYMLWVPSSRGLRGVLPNLKLETINGMVVATAGPYMGAGVGESEALISLMQDLRQNYSVM